MKIPSGILALFLLSLPVSRLSAEDFDPYTAATTPGFKTLDAMPPEKAGEPAVTSITDKASWDKLLKAVIARPTQVQTIQQGASTYRIYSVTTRAPISGQQCQNGTAPYNSIFISKAVTGSGNDIYPARISLVCRDEAGIKDSLYIDADIEGRIIDASVFNGSLGLMTRPLTEKPTGLAGKYSFDTFLNKAVKHFTSAASGN